MEWRYRPKLIELLRVLDEHLGAVQRDLIAAGLCWSDVGSCRLSFGDFVSFVVFAPPGTAVYHARFEGFTPDTHLLAMAVDELRTLVWLKTEDALLDPGRQQHRPKPIPRPGVEHVDPDAAVSTNTVTVGEYMKVAGLTMRGGDDGSGA